jgi:hypothetical protein
MNSPIRAVSGECFKKVKTQKTLLRYANEEKAELRCPEGTIPRQVAAQPAAQPGCATSRTRTSGLGKSYSSSQSSPIGVPALSCRKITKFFLVPPIHA